MTTPSHISLPWRKALLARLLAYEAFADLGTADDEDPASSKVVGEMMERGAAAIKLGGQKPVSDLDAWLRESVGIARKVTEAVYGPLASTRADTILTKLESEAKKLSCADCAAGKRVCRGGQRDDHVVAAGGHCFRHATDLFMTVARVAEAYYREYASGFEQPPTLVMSSSEAATKPHVIPVPIFIGAETRYEDDATGPVSAIDMKIAVRLLDWNSWLAAFYLLLHETVCHAFAGITPPHRGRSDLKFLDPFAEGWMNFVCDMILEDVMNSAQPAFPAAASLRFRARAVKAGQFFSQYQEGLERDGGDKAFTVVQSWEAAQQVFQTLQRLPAGPGQARAAMYRLSLDLNLLDRSARDRARLVTIIARDLRSDATARYGWVIRLITQYLDREIPPNLLFNELLRA